MCSARHADNKKPAQRRALCDGADLSVGVDGLCYQWIVSGMPLLISSSRVFRPSAVLVTLTPG